MPIRESENKYLGGRTDAELEASFANMYHGWERGLNITQERFGDGETKFTERPMTDMELAARYVAAEIGLNIFEIANKAAFAPIIVYSQIQARLGPVFERLAALSAAPVDGADVRWAVNYLLEQIAAKFEAWDTMDLWRSDAASLVRSFKHDLSKVAQEPVAYQWRFRGGKWRTCGKDSYDYTQEIIREGNSEFEVRPLYASPPATPAGLGADEIAEILGREEDYLVDHLTAECGLMSGDIEGSFHRIKEYILALLSRGLGEKP